jgi:N-acetylglutamate synthase-like GNAT family acetyltransferase
MNNYTTLQNDFIISTQKSKLNISVIHKYLSTQSYWAKNISVAIVQNAIDGSLCFGVYTKENIQVGFARVITDYATFAYLADVFITENNRGIGLSKWLMYEIMNHPQLQGLRRWMLATKDAHGLYQQFGFIKIETSTRLMGLSLIDEYPAE